jgi:hypothetical protein
MNNLICQTNPEATIVYALNQTNPFIFHSDKEIIIPINCILVSKSESELTINAAKAIKYEITI